MMPADCRFETAVLEEIETAGPETAHVVGRALLKNTPFSKPIVAAVNGDCIAGGLDLSDTQYERRRFSGLGAYRASKASPSRRMR